MGKYTYSIWIDAAPIRVWEVFTNLDRIPEWQTGDPRVAGATGPGDVAGTQYRVQRGPGVAHTTVIKAEPPNRYASRTAAYLGLKFDLTANLVPEKEGTRLQLQAQTLWPRGLRLIGRLVELAFLNPREANRELKRLKVVVEGEAAG